MKAEHTITTLRSGSATGASVGRSRWLYIRLWLLFFLAYGPVGAMVPFFTLHLEELGLTPVQIGWACSTQAMGAMLAPLIFGQIADRWLAADRCVTLCAIATAALLWLLGDQADFLPLFAVAFVYWIVMTPLMTLANAIGFTHLPPQHFGWIRAGGTLGWMVQGWLLGYWFSQPEWLVPVRDWLHTQGWHGGWVDAFRLGSVMAVVVALYSLTLPATPPKVTRTSSFLAPLAAMGMLKHRMFAIYFICTVGLCVTMPFTTQTNPLLLRHLGVPRNLLGPTMTLAQTTEFLALGLLPWILGRLGQRRTMLLGLSSWLVGLTILTIGEPCALVVVSLLTYGLYICCYLVAGQVFVNSEATGDTRVSAQGMVTLATGLGLLAGNLLVGWVRHWTDAAFTPTYAVAVALAGVFWVVFLLGFGDGKGVESAQNGVPTESRLGTRTPVAREVVIHPAPST